MTAMDDKKRDKSTIFVRGVGFSSSPAEFEAFFSEVGPVRTSFLVKDKGQTGHKGFGFVQYALPEDAQKAAAELHNTEFQGRKLKVCCLLFCCDKGIEQLQQHGYLSSGRGSCQACTSGAEEETQAQ